MEKISIQSTYTQVSLYARLSGPASARKNGGTENAPPDQAAGALAHTADTKGGECARSKDGDTFSLSIEARTLQISQSITIENSGAEEGANADAAEQSKQPTGTDTFKTGGLVNALMDALKTISGKGDKHRPHFPGLSGPSDVANALLDQLDKLHAEKGGSKADFAAEIKKRLAGWKQAGSSTRVTVEYQEFRSEVRMQLTSGLDAWAQGPDAAGTDPGAGTASDSGAGSEAPVLT
jgi:hypothetical protein